MAVSYAQHRQFLLSYLRPQWPRVAALAALLFSGISLQLLTPQILARFIDLARGGAEQEVLVRLAGLFLAAALTGQVISALSVYASENVG